MELKKAIEELRKGDKRKFNQTLDLIVNLQNFDVRKESFNIFIKLPNPAEKKIAAFLTRKTKLVDTIIKEEFDKYNDPKKVKALAKKYDFFIAAAPLMGQIASKFGRVFGPMNKMPSPQAGVVPLDNDDAVQEEIKKLKSLVRVRTKELSIKVPVGKEEMKDEELADNINAAVKELESKLPKGRDNIKNIMIKFTMTPTVKVDY